MDGTCLLRKSFAAVISAALLCSFGGCRTDPSTQLLERELRKQEDKIYKLKDSLAMCREENETLRRQLAGAGVAVAVPAAAPVPAQTVAPSGIGAPAAPAAPQIVAPPIPGTEKSTAPPAGTFRGSQAEPQGVAPQGPALLPPGDPAAGRKPPAAVAVLPDSRQVDRVTVNRALTGGFRGSGHAADEGISVVIEPRDKQGRLLAAPGEISIVVLDRAVEGEAARVARWDFSRDQVSKLLPAAREGIYLELPWPGKPPAHPQLQVFVRYTTTDGRKLQVDQPLEVHLAGDGRGKWNPLPPGAAAVSKQPVAPANREATTAGGRAASPAARLTAAPSASPPKPSPSSPASSAEVVPAPAGQPLSPAGKEPVQTTAPGAPPSRDESPKRPVWSPNRN